MKREQQALSKFEKQILERLTPMIVNDIREVITLTLAEEPKAKPPQDVRKVRNGVTQPPAGGKCRAIWEELDKMVKANNGGVPKVLEAMSAARGVGLNENNARCEYYYWRRFNGYGKKQQGKNKGA